MFWLFTAKPWRVAVWCSVPPRFPTMLFFRSFLIRKTGPDFCHNMMLFWGLSTPTTRIPSLIPRFPSKHRSHHSSSLWGCPVSAIWKAYLASWCLPSPYCFSEGKTFFLMDWAWGRVLRVGVGVHWKGTIIFGHHLHLFLSSFILSSYFDLLFPLANGTFAFGLLISIWTMMGNDFSLHLCVVVHWPVVRHEPLQELRIKADRWPTLLSM